MSETNFSLRKPIQPLFPYTDRSIENILIELDRRLRGTGITVQSLEPYIFQQERKSHRLSPEDKAVIENKIERLINYYTTSPVIICDLDILRAKNNNLLYFKSKEQCVKEVQKGFQHQFQKVINNYRSDFEKIYANKYTQQAMYCLNHFINSDKRIEIKQDHKGIRALNIHLWNFDFQAALYVLTQAQTSPDHPDLIDTQLLIRIVRIFQNISFIVSKDEDLQKRFYLRKQPDVIGPREGNRDEICIPHTLLSQQLSLKDVNQILKLTLGCKIYLLKKCLKWAVQLAKSMSQIAKADLDKKNNCYISYLFLSNDLQAPNYSLILQYPQLKQVDKFAFAFRFLRNKKFAQYKIKLQRRLQSSSDLLELGLCHSSKLQAKIMQNYVDQTGDIRIVAILALYEKIRIGDKKSQMDIFIQKYKNMLTQFNQQTKLQQFKNKQKDIRQKSKTYENSRKGSATSTDLFQLNQPFFSRIDILNKKIKYPVIRKEYPKSFCWICRSNVVISNSQFKNKKSSQDFYAQCEKCRHGGHLKHLNLWFQNNIRCPIPDCNCCCN